MYTLNCSAKFAPNSALSDKYTTSPRLVPRDKPVRTATISERIAQRFKDIQKKAANLADGAPSDEKSQLLFSDEKDAPKVDKGKGKAVAGSHDNLISDSPPPLSPQGSPETLVINTSSSPSPPEPPEPIMLAGLSLPPAAISDLLARASSELKLQPIRVPIVGEYLCFTGEEFVTWLNQNVEGFGGGVDRA